jgi:hypothetical protein
VREIGRQAHGAPIRCDRIIRRDDGREEDEDHEEANDASADESAGLWREPRERVPRGLRSLHSRTPHETSARAQICEIVTGLALSGAPSRDRKGSEKPLTAFRS